MNEHRWSRPIGSLCLYAVVLWSAYGGGWFAVFMAACICVSDFTSDRWIYWHRRLDEIKSKRQEVPNGMCLVTMPDKPPVLVPLGLAELELIARIHRTVEGDEP